MALLRSWFAVPCVGVVVVVALSEEQRMVGAEKKSIVHSSVDNEKGGTIAAWVLHQNNHRLARDSESELPPSRQRRHILRCSRKEAASLRSSRCWSSLLSSAKQGAFALSSCLSKLLHRDKRATPTASHEDFVTNFGIWHETGQSFSGSFLTSSLWEEV